MTDQSQSGAPTPFDDDDGVIEGDFNVVHPVDPVDQSQDELDATAHNEARADYAGLQLILLPEGATSADAVNHLTKSVPVNSYGLPTLFYRSDMLPFPLSSLTADGAEQAAVYLNYDEGYPTYDGKIFWYQLPHEPLDLYLVFQRYLDQAEEVGIRQLQKLAMDNKMSFDKVQKAFWEYCWASRARAYDLFNIAAERKRKEIRARKMEDDHYTTAGNLLDKLAPQFEEPDFFKNLTPKEAMEVLRLLINIQRVSTGLSQNGNAGKTEFNPDGASSTSALMREITEKAGQETEGMGIDANMAALLADPNFAFEAQRLVIRVRRGAGSDTDVAQVKAIQDDA